MNFSRVATYYTKVMERVLRKGDAFVTTEIDRLERLLGKTSFALDNTECKGLGHGVLIGNSVYF